MRSPPIRSAASSSSLFLGARDRRLAAAVRAGARRRSAWAARFAPLSRETLLLANNLLLVVACATVLLGTLYPLLARCARPGQDLGRPALLRRCVRAADGAGGVPDGRRPAGALEAAPSCPTSRARLRWAAGVARRGGAARRRWLLGRHGRRWRRSACCWRSGSSPPSASTCASACAAGGAVAAARRALRAAAAPLLRHAARAPRASRCSSSASRWSTATRSSATCAWRSATRSTLGGYAFTLRRRARACRARTTRAARGAIEVTRDGAPRRARCIPRSASTTCSSMPMTEAGDRHRLHARPLRVARRAGRAAAPGRARLRQAVRRLDLGRLPADGARRPARRDRPALPRARAARDAAARTGRRDAGRAHEALCAS